MEVYLVVLGIILLYTLARFFNLISYSPFPSHSKPIKFNKTQSISKPKLYAQPAKSLAREKEMLEQFNYLHIPKMQSVDQICLNIPQEFLESDELDEIQYTEERPKFDISPFLQSKKIEIPKYNKFSYRLDDDSFASSRESTPIFKLKPEAKQPDSTPSRLTKFHQDKQKEWRELSSLSSIDEKIEKFKEGQYQAIYRLLEDHQSLQQHTTEDIVEMKKVLEKKNEEAKLIENERSKKLAEDAKLFADDRGVDYVNRFRDKFDTLKHLEKEDPHWDFNAEVGKITSDLADTQHLYGRIEVAIRTFTSYTGNMEEFLLFASDKLVTRALDNLEEREVGIDFAINYTQFIIEINKHIPEYEDYCIVRAKTYRRIFIPAPFSKEKTLERYNLQDGNYKGLNTEDGRQAFSREMDRTRGLGYLLGAIYTHPDSKFYITEAWNWLYKVVQYPIELLDRATLPALQGFLATCGKHLQNVDTARWNEFIKNMKEEYFPKLKEKFKPITHYSPYLTQLDQVIRQY